jgi:hypothetical protein
MLYKLSVQLVSRNNQEPHPQPPPRMRGGGNKEFTTNNQQLTTNNQQLTTNNQQ